MSMPKRSLATSSVISTSVACIVDSDVSTQIGGVGCTWNSASTGLWSLEAIDSMQVKRCSFKWDRRPGSDLCRMRSQ